MAAFADPEMASWEPGLKPYLSRGERIEMSQWASWLKRARLDTDRAWIRELAGASIKS
jgi:hypothetical protein